MTELRLGERVPFRGRAYEITGFTPLSVKPRCAFLVDVSSGEQIVVNMREIAAHLRQGDFIPHGDIATGRIEQPQD